MKSMIEQSILILILTMQSSSKSKMLPSATAVETEDIETLLQTFMVAKNLTMDITPDLEAYTKEAVKYTSCISTEFLPDPTMRNTDYDHIPLVSISNAGGSHGNGAFCRVSVQHTNPETLYVSFRPLYIEHVEELTKNIPGNALQWFRKFTRRTPLDLTKPVSLDNLMHLVMMLDGSADGLSANGLSRAMEEELKRPAADLTVENWFKTLVRRKAYQPYIKGLMENKGLFSGEDGRMVPGSVRRGLSFLEGLLTVIGCYKPTRVVFGGFSLGASMAAGASYLCHLALTAAGAAAPEFHLYQYSGVCVGDARMNAYVRAHFEKSLYITLTRNYTEIDPVCVIARGVVVPIGNIVNMDVIDHRVHRINLADYETLGKVVKLTMKQLVMYYVLRMKRAEPFIGIHLAGEDVIERVLTKELLDRGAPIRFGRGLSCDYFTSTGYSGKYKICPVKRNMCRVKKTRAAKGRVKNQCVPTIIV